MILKISVETDKRTNMSEFAAIRAAFPRMKTTPSGRLTRITTVKFSDRGDILEERIENSSEVSWEVED